MTARSLERARARSHTAGAHAIPTRTVASCELFGVLADAQRVTVVSAPAGRTQRSVRTAHASLISDVRDLLSGRTPPAPRRSGATPGATIRKRAPRAALPADQPARAGD